MSMTVGSRRSRDVCFLGFTGVYRCRMPRGRPLLTGAPHGARWSLFATFYSRFGTLVCRVYQSELGFERFGDGSEGRASKNFLRV